MTKRVVCVLGVPRSGSTRTISILSGFENLCVRGEIFQQSEIRLPADDAAALARSVGLGTLSSVGAVQQFVLWLRLHPNETINWLQATYPGRTVAFKLFGGHIASEIELERLFARQDIRFLRMRRRPIDAYVSLKKARAAKAVRNVVTTGIKVDGSLSEFLDQWARHKRWYARCSAMMNADRRACLDVSFDGEVSLSDERFGVALREKLKILGIDSGKFVGVTDTPVTRQDFAASYAEKLSNWSTFSAALRAHPDQFEAFTEQ